MRHLIWLAIAAAAIGLIGSSTGQDPLGSGDSNTSGDLGDSNTSGDLGDSDGSGDVDDSNASGDVGGTLNVVDLNVPAGKTIQVTCDVVVNASGDVRIEGTLASATVTTPAPTDLFLSTHGQTLDLAAATESESGEPAREIRLTQCDLVMRVFRGLEAGRIELSSGMYTAVPWATTRQPKYAAPGPF